MSQKKPAFKALTSATDGTMTVTIPGAVPKGPMSHVEFVSISVGTYPAVQVRKVRVDQQWHLELRVQGQKNADRLAQLEALLNRQVALELAAGWAPDALTTAWVPLSICEQLAKRVSAALTAQLTQRSTKQVAFSHGA